MDQRDAAGRAGPDGVVELRVHGVSAIGPDDLLDRPHVQQVAGDHRGGFYRAPAGKPRGRRDGRSDAGGVPLEQPARRQRGANAVDGDPVAVHADQPRHLDASGRSRLRPGDQGPVPVVGAHPDRDVRAEHGGDRAGCDRVEVHVLARVPGRTQLALLARGPSRRTAPGGARAGASCGHQPGVGAQRAPGTPVRTSSARPTSLLRRTGSPPSAGGTTSRWSVDCARFTSRRRSPRWTSACSAPGPHRACRSAPSR